MRRLFPLYALVLVLTACTPTTSRPPVPPGPEFSQLQRAFLPLAGVTQLQLQPQPDGGTLVSGTLNGAAFVLRFPAHWNHQSLVFAHGYTLVSASPDTIPADPVQRDPSAGILPAAYAQGFVVGLSAYDKRGFAVESGIERTVALSRLLGQLGASRAYIAGFSQGGSITELALERYPQQFSGALAACGVVGGWEKEIGYTTHLRALYNYFAAGTAYQLPGQHDVTRVAGATTTATLAALLKVYAAAALNPHGQAARILQRTASAVPDVQTRPDIGTIGSTLLTQMTGIEDFSAQAGGLFVDNSRTVYHSPLLTGSENRALNQGIQRYQADPEAQATARQQFAPGGHFAARLLTIHNAYDPLVPLEHEQWLRGQVQAAGNGANLQQLTVPATYRRLPTKLLGFEGADHCGFSKEQGARAWNTLRAWVEAAP